MKVREANAFFVVDSKPDNISTPGFDSISGKSRKTWLLLAVLSLFCPVLSSDDVTLESFIQNTPRTIETNDSPKPEANLLGQSEQLENQEAINITDSFKKNLNSNYQTTISEETLILDDNTVDEDMTVIEKSVESIQFSGNAVITPDKSSDIEEVRPSSWLDLPIESDSRYLSQSTEHQSEQHRMDRLLNILLNNGSITEQQRNLLLNNLDAAVPVTQPESIPAKDVMAVETKDELSAMSAKKVFSLSTGGRLMWDLANYQQDQVKLGNGTELRRASIEFEGRIFTDWEYKYSVDFSDSDVDINSASVEYSAIPKLEFRLGQFKEPFSLENQTSSKYITFMERALINDFAPGYHLGVGLHKRGKNWSTSIGLFGGAVDDDVDDEGDEGWSVTGRATYIPWNQDDNLLHIGMALSHRSTDDDNEVRINARPESHITDIKYLNTGTISDVSKVSLHGLEFAFVQDSFSAQSEYVQSRLDRDSANSLSFSGWYIYGSWFITGESRPYKAKNGNFGRVKPREDSGAWELAIRHSKMELTDSDIRGGIANQTTLGVNWYINSHMRLMANYIMVDNDENADDDGDVSGNDDPGIFQIRTQIDF